MLNNLNEKAQIGTTVSWLVATVLIVVILLFFIFGASLLAKTKDISNFRESLFSESEFKGDDIFLKKSLYTYNLIGLKAEKRLVEEVLIKNEEEGNFNLPLNETKELIKKRLGK